MAISFGVTTNLSVSSTLTAGDIVSSQLFSPNGQNLLLGTQNNGVAIEIDNADNSSTFTGDIKASAIKATAAGITFSNLSGSTVAVFGDGGGSGTGASFAGSVTLASSLILTTGAITVSTMTLSGKLVVSSTQASSSTITGSAVFGGGVGVAGSLCANAVVSSTTLTDQGGTIAAQRNALATAQALSFGGTAASTATLASTPSGNQTQVIEVQAPLANPSTTQGILTLGGSYAAAQTYGILINTAGDLQIVQFGASGADYRVATVSSFVTSYSGQRVILAPTISYGALVIYINGKSISYAEATAGTAPAWGATLASGSVTVGACASYYFTGTIRLLAIENRALSAAEVLQLYQTKTIPSSDIALNTNDLGAIGGAGLSIINGDNADFSSDTGYWLKFGSVTISGGVLTVPDGTTDYVIHTGNLIAGKRYRFTAGTVTGSIVIADPYAFQAVTTGQVVEFVARGDSFAIGAAAAAGGTLDSFTLESIGALVAPDPTQLGSGSYWYDVSGNDATITLGAGVNWVNKWSGKLPSAAIVGSASVGGDLTVSGSTGTASANKVTVDYVAGTTGRIIVRGPDNSTPGAFQLVGLSANDSAGDIRASFSNTGAFNVNTSLSVASTSPIKGVRTGTAAFSQDSITSGSGFNTSITVTGVAAGDAIFVCMADNSHIPDGCTVTPIVNGSNTANIRFYNASGSTVSGLTGRSFRYVVVSF